MNRSQLDELLMYVPQFAHNQFIEQYQRVMPRTSDEFSKTCEMIDSLCDKKYVNPEQEIIVLIEKHLGITFRQIRGKKRNRNIVEARQLFFKFMRLSTSYTLHYIASRVGKDHATALHSCRVIDNLYVTDKNMFETVNLLCMELNQLEITQPMHHFYKLKNIPLPEKFV